MSDEIYRGPNWTPKKTEEVVGEYTAADQARGWRVPEEQLQPEASTDVAPETVKAVE